MTTKSLILLAVAGTLLSIANVVRAQTITGGDFSTWTGTTSSNGVVTGTPSGWIISTGSSLPVEFAYGTSNTGAIIKSGTSSGGANIAQSITGGSTAYTLSFDVALSGATSTGRLFQLYLTDKSGQTPINLIATPTTGGAKFQVYGSGWHDLAGTTSAPVLLTSTYDSASSSFSNLTMYHVVIQVNNMNSATGMSYTISFGLAGDTYTPLFTSDVMPYVYNASGADSSLGKVNFFGTYGGASDDKGSYLLDNVALSAIPEPTAMAMMAGGLLLLGGRLIRRRE